MTNNPGIADFKKTRPSEYRPMWKAAKTKYKDALAAKQVTFGEDLGKLLDKRAKQWEVIEDLTAQLKRIKLTKDEQNETDPAKRKATAKLLKANDASNLKIAGGHYKTMITICNAVIKAARSYKSKVQGLGDPAEEELSKALTQIEEGTEKDLAVILRNQGFVNKGLADPHRHDYLK